MDWTRPINTLIPGLDGIALDRLWRVTGSQTAPEIHRRAGAGSLMGFRYALDRLVTQGVVKANQAGNTILYELNKDHLAFPALQALLENYHPYGDLRERLARLVERHWENKRHQPSLAIYGSVARQQGTIESDLDLLLVVRSHERDSSDLEGLTAALHREPETWTGNPVHLYVATRDELRAAHDSKDPIAVSWDAEVDTVYGPDVRELMRERT